MYADQLSGKIDRRKIGQDTKHFYKKKATLPAPGTSILHLPVTLHILTYLYGPCWAQWFSVSEESELNVQVTVLMP